MIPIAEFTVGLQVIATVTQVQYDYYYMRG